MQRVDLHTHTTFSDGTMTPSELVEYAVSKGLKAIAITDHDTIAGIPEAMDKASELREKGYDIEVIPGVEFSSDYYGHDIHVVGLYIDYNNEFLNQRMQDFINSRNERNELMCQKCTAYGLPITVEELEEAFPGAVITRAHFARMMFQKGYVKSVKEAFERYVGDHGPCFVSRKKTSPFRKVEIIRKAGGFPVLAHPVLYGFGKDTLSKMTSDLKAVGLMGIEAIYSTYTPSDERDIRSLASQYDLTISGGSDFHGANKPNIDLGTGLGHLFVPDEVLNNIKEAHQKMLKSNQNYRLKKILFTDLDGTLLRSDKTISQYTYDVLSKWTTEGNYLVLCSGRDVNSIRMVYEDLKINEFLNVYIAGYNGGQIYDCQRECTIYKKEIDIEVVKYLEELADEMNIHLQTYSETHIIAKKEDKELEYYRKVIKTPVLFSNSLSDALTSGPCKCLAIELDDRKLIEKYRDLVSEYGKEHGIEAMFSNDYYLEIIPKGSGKGTAVIELCKLIDQKGLMVVASGDEQNDISMLKEADIAIAMSNGIQEIKENATSISLDNCDNDGLAKTLEYMVQ